MLTEERKTGVILFEIFLSLLIERATAEAILMFVWLQNIVSALLRCQSSICGNIEMGPLS